MKDKAVMFWLMELPSGHIEADPNKARCLGYEPDKFSHYRHYTSLIHPEDYEGAMQAMRDHLEGKAPKYFITYRIKAADGSWHTFADQGIVRERDGENISLFGITMDTTKENQQ